MKRQWNYAIIQIMDIKNVIHQYFSCQKDILCVYLFGSFAKNKDNQFSDIDVAILFNENTAKEQYSTRILSFIDELSKLTNKEIDAVALNSSNTFLKYQIIKEGLRLFESTRPGRDFEAKAIIEYFDYIPIRKRLEKGLINKIKGA